MIKVCWISNAPSPYKVAFMNELGKQVELTCLFEMHAEKDRNASWYDYDALNFNAIYLDDGDGRKHINHCAKECDVLINSDYSKPACRFAVRAFHQQQKKTILHADGGLVKERGLFDKIISHVMRRNDAFMSSGKEVNRYFEYYGVKPELIHNYRFASTNQMGMEENYQLHQNQELYRNELQMKEETVLLSIGSPIPRKGFDILVRAMKDIPSHVGLYIIGGEPQKEVAAYVQDNALTNIHFLPFFDWEMLKKYYAAADLFVLPTRYDIWGLVINEAMSFGLPFISTDHCVAAKEFVGKDECGKIVPIEDVNALKEAIEGLVSDPNKRKEMGEKGYQIIRDYTYENMVEDFVKILNSVVGN
ncbi:MAG: glycosyltransferase family 4 protein [Solobacterium sp.]|nr:glycosyltransferase family 4 protein [Solobacterium sp.]